MAILAEQKIVQNLNLDFLGRVQVMLFMLGAASILASVVVEDQDLDWATMGGSNSKTWYLKKINQEINDAEDFLCRTVRAMENTTTLNFRKPEDAISARLEEEKLRAKISGSVERLVALSETMKSKIQVL
jgi:hypothetical protein